MKQKALGRMAFLVACVISFLNVTRAFAQSDSDTNVPGRYIVVLKPDFAGIGRTEQDDSLAPTDASAEEQVGLVARQIASSYGGTVRYIYSHVLKGFSVEVSAQSADVLRQSPQVQYVEQVKRVSIDTTQASPPSWGLDRIDQRDLPLSASYSYDSTGAGVRVYILDTGIRITHADFGTRASYGTDIVDGALPADDCNGHGTHVAGTVAGTTYGVAKGAQVVAVRVLDCSGSGTTDGVIAGLDWVRAQKTGSPSVPFVVNMSLSGSASQPFDDAVANAVAAGIVVVVAAGNSNSDACQYSPARAAAAITVGATTIADARASFSNIGTCLDIFAPGQGITSAWYTSDTASATLDGTSMAAPHVAGVAARYLEIENCASPATVSTVVANLASTGKVTNAGTGSPDRLLYSVLPTNPAPATPSNFSVIGGGCYGGNYSSWNASSYTSSYQLYRSKNGGTFNLKYAGCGLEYQDNNTYLPGTYTYKVKACNGAGCSAFSGELDAYTPLHCTN